MTETHITMKKIAEMANVSSPVVSAVLGGKSTCRVSEKKRQLILNLVKEYKYQPNVQASCLRQGRKAEVGVFLPDWKSLLLLDLIQGLNSEAQKHDIPLSYNFGLQIESYANFLENMVLHNHTAIISYAPFYEQQNDDFTALLSSYQKKGGYIISLNHNNQNILHNYSLTINEQYGGMLAARYLRTKGCRSYAAIGSASMTPIRHTGFTEELGKETPFYKISLDDISTALLRILEEIHATCTPPVGIFCMDEYLLVYLMDMLKKYWCLNQNLFLVSYESNSRYTQYLHIGQIIQPFLEEGILAIQQLEHIFTGRKATDQVLNPVLIEH